MSFANDYSAYEGHLPDVDYASLQNTTPIQQGFERDPSGAMPKQRIDPHEYAAYQAVRAELDRPIQVVGATPTYPQQDTARTPAAYRRQLLGSIAMHTREYQRYQCQYIPDDKLQSMQAAIVADALATPAREGRLAEVKIVDRTGREISEFVGDKAWFRSMKGRVQATGIVIDGIPRRI